MPEQWHGVIYVVSKTFLKTGEVPLNAGAYVEEARRVASTLEENEMKAALTRPRARLRIASRFGIPAAVLHSLRYRPPKTITADMFDRLLRAVEHQAEEQIRNLEHEITKARSCRLGIDNGHIGAAETAARRARALLERTLK